MPKLFHDKGLCHIETSPLICFVNQWTGFYMIETTVMKELNGLKTYSARKKTDLKSDITEAVGQRYSQNCLKFSGFLFQ